MTLAVVAFMFFSPVREHLKLRMHDGVLLKETQLWSMSLYDKT